MKIRVSCEDKYEAQKLASLIYLDENKETYITQILNVVENEMVISIKDKSAHSILLKDNTHVEKFADFIQSVLEQKHKIVGTATFVEEVEITKE